MPQAFASFDTPAEVLVAQWAGSGYSLYLPDDVVADWAGVGLETMAGDSQVTVLPGNGLIFDPTIAVWLILTWQGLGGFKACDQAQAETLDTFLGAGKHRAVWGRYVEHKVETWQQP